MEDRVEQMEKQLEKKADRFVRSHSMRFAGKKGTWWKLVLMVVVAVGCLYVAYVAGGIYG